MPYLSLQDLPLQKKKVLVRVDFNVPIDATGRIIDATRIEASLPTIRYLRQQQASIILLSHLGKPKGKSDPRFSLIPCQKALETLLQYPVGFACDCLQASSRISSMQPGEILLLENLRFYPAEEKPSLDPSFASTLASYADYYINDAFGACHREHSSITSLPLYFPHRCAMGLLVEKEQKALHSLITNPLKPFHVILGGAKISSKLPILQTLLPKLDALYIGGAMAFTFYQELGMPIGDSLFEPLCLSAARNILEKCRQQNIPLYLPDDIRAYQESPSPKTFPFPPGLLPSWKGGDIGPLTLQNWQQTLPKAQTIFWNGPMGIFEIPAFAEGTLALAQTLSSFSSTRIIGGGDSVAAIQTLQKTDAFTHISTGGGACLEYIEKGTLPGMTALWCEGTP